MTERSIHLLTGAYALDALPAEECQTFVAHLAECDSCATETAELMATAARLALLTERPAPEQLRATILRAVERTRQLAPVVTTPLAGVVDLDSRRGTRRRWVAAVGGALAAAAAIAGAVFVLGDEGDPVGDVIAAGDARTYSSELPDGGAATLYVSASEEAGVITFSDLPDPGSGQTYQMWLLDAESNATPEDTFDPSASGSASVLLEGASEAFSVAITVEPDGGSSAPTSTPLAIIALA